jgi:hypothetical protein
MRRAGRFVRESGSDFRLLCWCKLRIDILLHFQREARLDMDIDSSR